MHCNRQGEEKWQKCYSPAFKGKKKETLVTERIKNIENHILFMRTSLRSVLLGWGSRMLCIAPWLTCRCHDPQRPRSEAVLGVLPWPWVQVRSGGQVQATSSLKKHAERNVTAQEWLDRNGNSDGIVLSGKQERMKRGGIPLLGVNPIGWTLFEIEKGYWWT